MTRKYTNSSFRTHAERTLFRGMTTLQIFDWLLHAGVPDEEADEYADDPNSIPTELRRRLLQTPKPNYED